MFSEKWSHEHENVALKLAAASTDAKAFLASNDAEWDRLRPTMNVKSDAEFAALKAGYLAGIPKTLEIDLKKSQKFLSVIAEVGGTDLVGAKPDLAAGTFAQTK